MKRLTKSFAVLLTLVMCFTLCFTTAYAVSDSSDGKLYVNYDVDTVMHSSGDDLSSVAVTATSSNGTSDTVNLTPDLYNSSWRQYQLQFDIGGFKVGDKISFAFSDASVTQDISDVTLEVQTIYEDYDIGGEGTSKDCLVGTADLPLNFSLIKDYEGIAKITIKDEGNNPVGNKEVVISTYSGMFTERFVTDSNGNISVDTTKFDSDCKLYFENKEFLFKNGGDDPTDSYMLSFFTGGRTYDVVIVENVEYVGNREEEYANYYVTVKAAREGLFNADKTLTLVFSDAFTSKTVDGIKLGDNFLSLADKTYTISVGENIYGYVAEPVHNVASGKNIEIVIDTSSTLKVVDTSGGATTFTVENVAELTGKTFEVGKEYAALNGDSFIIKDNNGSAYVVDIANDKGLTTIDLADGSVSSTGSDTNKTSPQTSDSVGLWTILLGVAVLALAVLAFLYFKNSKNAKKGTQILSLLLVCTLMGGIVAEPITSYAWSIEGAADQPAGEVGGGSKTPFGAFQTAESGYGDRYMKDQAFLKVSLVINDTSDGEGAIMYVGDNATVEQMEQDSKFWFQTDADQTNTAIYLTNESHGYQRLLKGGIIGMHWEGEQDIRTLHGKNHLTNVVTNQEEHWHRLFDMGWDQLDKMKRDGGDENRDIFMDFFRHMLYTDDLSAPMPLYQPIGDHIRAYVDGKFNNPGEQNEEKQAYEASVMYGYMDYLLDAGLISSNHYKRLIEAYANGKLVILVESVMAMYIIGDAGGAEESALYGMSAHDVMMAFRFLGNGKISYPSRELSVLRDQYGEGAVEWASPWKSKINTCAGNRCSNKNCKALRHLPWSGVRNMLNIHLNVLRPASSTIDQNNNPFGGWGYVTLGSDPGKAELKQEPGLWATYEYTLLDENGNVLDEIVETEVDGWGINDLSRNTLYNLGYNMTDTKMFPAPAVIQEDRDGDGTVEQYVLCDPSGALLAEYFVTESRDNNMTEISKIDNILLSDDMYNMLTGTGFIETELTLVRVLRDLRVIMSTLLGVNEMEPQKAVDYINALGAGYETLVKAEAELKDSGRAMEALSVRIIINSLSGFTADALREAQKWDEEGQTYYYDLSTFTGNLSNIRSSWYDIAFSESVALEKSILGQHGVDIIRLGSGVGNTPEYEQWALNTNYFGGVSLLEGAVNNSTAKNKDFAMWTENGWEYDISLLQSDKIKQLAGALNNSSKQSIYYNTGVNGNVKIKFTGNIVYKRTTPPPPTGDSLAAKGDVPQWRVNKYWDSMLPLLDTTDKTALYSSGKLTYSDDDSSSHATSYLQAGSGDPARTVSSAIAFTKNDISTSPFFVNVRSNTTNAYFSHSDPTAPIQLWSDLVANKKASVDNLTPAKWVSEAPITYIGDGGSKVFNLTPSEGDDKTAGDTQVIKDIDLIFSYSPTKTIYHLQSYYEHKWTGRRYKCKCNTTTETASFIKDDVEYNVEVAFDCFNQVTKTPPTIADTRTSVDGKTELTTQSAKNIRLYSEVPMMFTTTPHHDTIRFMSADKATEIKPISYHTIAYDTMIKPTLSGIAATDYRAVETLADMGIVDAQMLLKGSATTTAYDMTGWLTATSYALDVDDNYYKNLWTNNDYTAEKVNSEFLLGFANPQADGTYTATISATENLKIGDQNYGNVKNDITVKSTGTTTTRYELTIRAGEITAINGKKDWVTRYPDIADILVNKMKANHAGVFSVFASGEGDVLDEPEFARLTKLLREGSESIAEGIGWYSEDCTTLSLYVYETKFKLEGTQFSNKVPTSIPDLETPQNKDLFYLNAKDGDLLLDLALQVVEPKYETPLHYETSADKWSDRIYDLYAVGNVSVLDSTN